jgi:hypothetical protein
MQALKLRLYEVLREHAREINGNAPSAVTPTQPGRFVNDVVPNANASVEQGSSGSKYLLTGWIWSGTQWLQMRALTGN